MGSFSSSLCACFYFSIVSLFSVDCGKKKKVDFEGVDPNCFRMADISNISTACIFNPLLYLQFYFVFLSPLVGNGKLSDKHLRIPYR